MGSSSPERCTHPIDFSFSIIWRLGTIKHSRATQVGVNAQVCTITWSCTCTQRGSWGDFLVMIYYAATIFSFSFSSLPLSFLYFHFISLPLYFCPPLLSGESLSRMCTHRHTLYNIVLHFCQSLFLSSYISFILSKSNLWQTFWRLCIYVCECVSGYICACVCFWVDVLSLSVQMLPQYVYDYSSTYCMCAQRVVVMVMCVCLSVFVCLKRWG